MQRRTTSQHALLEKLRARKLGQTPVEGAERQVPCLSGYLYLEGKIDQWYSLEDRAGVAFILNVTDVSRAHQMLEALPLGKEHLMTFSLLPIGPLNPLHQLLNPPSPQ